MTAGPTLDIVIVNWNAGAMLRRTLTSIPPACDGSFALERVVVVDNASSDDSLDGLEALPLPLAILRNGVNRGFGAASNQGAAGSTADYVLFLNPDTCLRPDSLSTPLRFMTDPAHADVGIVGIQMRDEHGHISRSSARAPALWPYVAKAIGLDAILPGRVPTPALTDWDHAETRELAHVIGAFYLVRRGLFERLRGFDERFFVYLEDVDFSVRVRQAGWRIYYLADAYAEHKGGGTSEAVKAARIALSLHSRIQFGFKHFGAAKGLVLAFVTLVVEPIPRLARALGRGSATEAVDTCRAFVQLWGRVLGGRRIRPSA